MSASIFRHHQNMNLQLQRNARVLGMRANKLETDLCYRDNVNIVNLPEVDLGKHAMRENGAR